MNAKTNANNGTKTYKTRYECNGCQDWHANMCQCLNCDPDGDRYLCTCEEDGILYTGSETGTIYYDEDILKGLKKMKDFIKKVKTQDYYVRGYEDQRAIMTDILDILITKQEEVCDE